MGHCWNDTTLRSDGTCVSGLDSCSGRRQAGCRYGPCMPGGFRASGQTIRGTLVLQAGDSPAAGTVRACQSGLERAARQSEAPWSFRLVTARLPVRSVHVSRVSSERPDNQRHPGPSGRRQVGCRYGPCMSVGFRASGQTIRGTLVLQAGDKSAAGTVRACQSGLERAARQSEAPWSFRPAKARLPVRSVHARRV